MTNNQALGDHNTLLKYSDHLNTQRYVARFKNYD